MNEDGRVTFPAFRIKTMEPIKTTSRMDRRQIIKECKYNLFSISAEDVMVDFLTDSGTGALSTLQVAAMHIGDESYAGSTSFRRFEAAVKSLFNFKHVLPTHQGRAAERILFQAVGGAGKIIPNNGHFDTTRGNIEVTGAVAIDLPCPQSKDLASLYPFKGNMDTNMLEDLLDTKGDQVPLVMVTATNNSGGGQPISMKNLRKVREICQKYEKKLFMDACRFAENAWFIHKREAGYEHHSIVKIVQEMSSLIDGMTMSAKKDGLSHIGGWLAMNDDDLMEVCVQNLILTEGFKTYGGLSGRDLEIIAQGLTEVVQLSHLEQRIGQVRYLGEQLSAAGVPVMLPIGGHAVYVDAGRLLPHIPPLQFPAQSLAIALYIEGGVRGVEIGSLMFGRQPDGSEKASSKELVRLAVPRRMYTTHHMDYVVDVFKRVLATANKLTGYELVKQPKFLRHFIAELRPVTWTDKEQDNRLRSGSFKMCEIPSRREGVN